MRLFFVSSITESSSADWHIYTSLSSEEVQQPVVPDEGREQFHGSWAPDDVQPFFHAFGRFALSLVDEFLGFRSVPRVAVRKSVKLICPVSEIRHVEHPSGENVVGAVEQSHRTQVQVAIDIDYTEIIPPIYKDIDFYKNGLGIIQDFDDM